MILFQPVDIRRDVPYDDTRRAETIRTTKAAFAGPSASPLAENNPALLAHDDPRYLEWRKRQAHGVLGAPKKPNHSAARCAAHAAAVKAIGGEAGIERVMDYLGGGFSTTNRYLSGAEKLGLLTRERINRRWVYRSA